MVKENTKAVFGESIANPALTVLDIEEFAKAAHAHGVPLIVDNTFPTPVNLRPIKWGADIVRYPFYNQTLPSNKYYELQRNICQTVDAVLFPSN